MKLFFPIFLQNLKVYYEENIIYDIFIIRKQNKNNVKIHM